MEQMRLQELEARLDNHQGYLASLCFVTTVAILFMVLGFLALGRTVHDCCIAP